MGGHVLCVVLVFFVYRFRFFNGVASSCSCSIAQGNDWSTQDERVSNTDERFNSWPAHSEASPIIFGSLAVEASTQSHAPLWSTHLHSNNVLKFSMRTFVT